MRCECGVEFNLRNSFKHMLFCKKARIECDENERPVSDSEVEIRGGFD